MTGEESDAPTAAAPRPHRLPAVDAARGLAVLAMVVYHFAWDLSFFGLADIDLFGDPFWLGFRTVILSSFLAIAGLAQALAASRGIDRRRWARRILVIAAAAALITLVTWLPLATGIDPALGRRFIWFGVLHHLALASVVGLYAVRLPWPAIAALAAGILALDALVSAPAFDAPWLIWLGLGTYMPATNDWVPVAPWLGVYLAGLAAGKAATRAIGRLPRGEGPVWRGLALTGRWSLPVYLLHQPVLIGLLLAVVTVTGWGGSDPAAAERAAAVSAFRNSCVAACESGGVGVSECRAYCDCVLDGMRAADVLDRALANRLTPDDQGVVDGLVAACRPAGLEP